MFIGPIPTEALVIWYLVPTFLEKIFQKKAGHTLHYWYPLLLGQDNGEGCFEIERNDLLFS